MLDKWRPLFFPNDHKDHHVKALDGLRGMAVLFVLLGHTSTSNLFFLPGLNFKGIGTIGVFLFFVLSAYLLDRQIALAFMNGKADKSFWGNYFLRRFLRIYPLFILALIAHGLLTSVGFRTDIQGAESIIKHLLLLRGDGIFWSIAVEFKYYFISPLLLFFFHRVFKWELKRTMVVLIVLILFSVLVDQRYTLSRLSTTRYLLFFLLGTLISIYEIKRKLNFQNSKQSGAFDLFGGLSFLIILALVPHFFSLIFGMEVNFASSIYYLPYGLLLSVLLIAAKYGKGGIRWIFELGWLRFLGVISYSLYLFHNPILAIVNSNTLNLPQGIKIYLFFISATVVASLSYLLIEKPLSKIRLQNQHAISEKN